MPFNTQPPYNITNRDNVTAVRALDTPYTNTKGKMLWVTVVCQHTVPALNDQTYARGEAPAGTEITRAQLWNLGGAVRIDMALFIPVKPGETYQVSKFVFGTGTLTLVTWIESW